jgi:hypothetical protein
MAIFVTRSHLSKLELIGRSKFLVRICKIFCISAKRQQSVLIPIDIPLYFRMKQRHNVYSFGKLDGIFNDTGFVQARKFSTPDFG